MIKTYLFVAAVIGAVTTPALACEVKPASAASTQAMRPAGDASPVARREPRYCIVETITGSIIPYRTCHTRAQWLAEGFDPLAK